MKRRQMRAVVIAALLVMSAAGASAQQADQAKIDAGEMVYSDYCSTCHGEKLRNSSGGLTFDLRKLRPEDEPRFRQSVANGKGQMPPWKGVLDDEQISAIWAYVRANAGS